MRIMRTLGRCGLGITMILILPALLRADAPARPLLRSTRSDP